MTWSAAGLLLGLGLAAGVGAVRAAEVHARSEYIVKNWQTADGLPQNIIHTILPTRDGYLWLGTQTGLARFDGVRFTAFTVANTPELLSDFVWELFEDRAGTLWIGTRRGVARLRGGRFTALGPREGLPEAVANDFAEDAAGTLWVVVGNRLFRQAGERFEAVTVNGAGNESAAVRSIRQSSRGELWVAAHGRLWRRAGEQFVDVAPLLDTRVFRLRLDGSDRAWVSVPSGVLKLKDGAWLKQGDGMGDPRNLLFTRNGDLWVTSPDTNKLFRLRAGQMTALGAEDGLPGNNATAVAEDREGNLWAAMNGTGLFRLRERRLNVFNTGHGLPTLKLTSLATDPNGNIFAGVDSQGVFRFGDGRFQKLLDETSVTDAAVPTSFLAQTNGGMVVGTFFGDLKFWDGQRVTHHAGGAFGTRVLLAARDGSLWRGTRLGGLEHHAGGTVTRYGTEQGLSVAEVLCLAQDASGAIWAGTERGLNRISEGKVTKFGRPDGLGSDYIAAVANDSRGTLWAGTLGGGLAAWRHGKFLTITTREGLLHDAVTQIIEDDLGHLWLGTRAGLMRVKLDDLHEFLDGRRRYIHGPRFGRDDGLAPTDCGTDNQPSCLKAVDGRLWFCSGSGLVVVNPQEIQANAQPPKVYVEEVAVDGVVQRSESRDPAVGCEVPPGKRRVEIRYTGLSFAAPSLVRFRYRLTGFDPDWIEAGEQRVATYSGLPPGRYAFHVTASNADGVWNREDAGIALTVRPAVWEAAWFRVAGGLFVLALVALVVRWRVARIERRRGQKEALARQLIDRQESERKRIAAEIHDGLGQSLMVVKNRAAIALRSRDNLEQMAAQLAEISQTATHAIAEAREISFNLRPHQLDSLGLAKGLTAMAHKVGLAAGAEVEVAIAPEADELAPEARVHLFRIAQEGLTNTAKHAQARRIRLEITRTADHLRLVVSDDGCGFQTGARPGGDLGGLGTATMRERTLVLGGTFQVESAPGRGTRVTVDVPLPRAADPHSTEIKT